MKISVIIPTYNEERNIIKLINVLKSELNSYFNCEVLIVDGGSTDNTVVAAEELGVKVYKSKKGRGNQLHIGAGYSTGEVLYFLHADSIPPKDVLNIINTEVERGTEVGCFQLTFSPSNTVLKFYEYFVRFPFLVCRGGDQSLFITKPLYQKIGGFNTSYKLMEDIDFIKRVSRISNFKVRKEKVITSSQKFITNGVIKLQILFAIMHFLFFVGVSNKYIVKFYNKTVI